MAIKITQDCINCGACEPECPNQAIYEAGDMWKYSEGTSIRGRFKYIGGITLDGEKLNKPLSDEFYYIVPNKCTECKGFHSEPQCAAVCPVDCCVPDENYVETDDILLKKKSIMHDS